MKEFKLQKIELILITAGLIVSGLVGFGQYQLGKIQSDFARQQANYNKDRLTEQQSVDSIRNVANVELQLMNFAKDFIPDISKSDEQGRIAKEVVLATAEYLSDEYQRVTLSNIVSRIYQEQQTGKQQDELDAFEIRIRESTDNKSKGNQWFAVIASYGSNQLELAKTFNQSFSRKAQIDNKGYKLQFWKTKISDNIVVTIDGKLSREEALERVNYVRENRWSDDAFVQVNREWTQIE